MCVYICVCVCIYIYTNILYCLLGGCVLRWFPAACKQHSTAYIAYHVSLYETAACSCEYWASRLVCCMTEFDH